MSRRICAPTGAQLFSRCCCGEPDRKRTPVRAQSYTGNRLPVPRPCLVLGCGRSGTSLAAGLLAGAGYDLGPGLLAADPSNPRGFFESRAVNHLNERLLEPVVSGRVLGASGRPASARPLREGERWLATLPLDIEVPADAALTEPMAASLADHERPVARKDPRFVWTAPAWHELLPGAAMLCVYREPLRTARSILAMTDTGNLGLTLDGALGVWASSYRRCLELSTRQPEQWLFVHYDQLVDGSALGRVSDLLGTRVPPGFADPSLRRSPTEGDVPGVVADLFTRLEIEAERLPSR